MSAGESVVAALVGTPELGGARAAGAPPPWNLAFDGGPLETGDEAGFVEYVVPDGRVTSIRGSSGMTWYPIEQVASAAERGEPVRLGSPLVGSGPVIAPSEIDVGLAVERR